MSEYDNLNHDDVKNTLDSFNNTNLINIYNYLTEFISYLFDCNGRKFSICQKILLSRKYRQLTKDLITQLFKEGDDKCDDKCDDTVFNGTHFRTLGLLPLIIYHPMTFYTDFNFDNYNEWVELQNSDCDIDNDNDNTNNTRYSLFYELYHISFNLKKQLQEFQNIINPNSIYDTELKFDKVIEIRKITLEYFSKFHNWKKEDEEAEIQKLIQSFWEIELTKSEVSKGTKYSKDQQSEIITELTAQQNELKSIIHKIGGSEGLEILNNSIPLVIDNNLINHIKNNLQLAFWKSIEDDIIEKSDYTSFTNVIKELIEVICNCRDDNMNFSNEVSNALDTELIIQQMANNVIDIDEILDYNYLLNKWVQQLDAPINDEVNNKSYKTLNKEILSVVELYKNILDSFNDSYIDTKNIKIKCVISVMAILYNHYYWKFKYIYDEVLKYER
jgi:hypothetical protein